MPVTAQEVREKNSEDTRTRMDSAGLTLDHLIKCLKKELKAQVTKTQKVKGVPHEVAKGVRTICVTGLIEKHRTADGIEKDYTEGDAVIAIPEIAWDIRQRARMDAHKLRGDYPADKLDVTHLGIREVLNALDGRSTGLPAQREEGANGSGA